MACGLVSQGGGEKYYVFVVFFFKQKTAYEIKECDWSSDVCSSDLRPMVRECRPCAEAHHLRHSGAGGGTRLRAVLPFCPSQGDDAGDAAYRSGPSGF